jgi:hypothetical protein
MSDETAGQVNADLLATCAQIAIAAVIVVGIDAAAMHVAARAISGGGTAETIRGRVRRWRHTVPKWLTPVISMLSSGGGESFDSLDVRIRNDPFLLRLINLLLIAGLVTAAAMPLLALTMAILGLWLRAEQLEGPVAMSTICSVLLVAILLYLQMVALLLSLQIKMEAKRLVRAPATEAAAASDQQVSTGGVDLRPVAPAARRADKMDSGPETRSKL